MSKGRYQLKDFSLLKSLLVKFNKTKKQNFNKVQKNKEFLSIHIPQYINKNNNKIIDKLKNTNVNNSKEILITMKLIKK